MPIVELNIPPKDRSTHGFQSGVLNEVALTTLQLLLFSIRVSYIFPPGCSIMSSTSIVVYIVGSIVVLPPDLDTSLFSFDKRLSRPLRAQMMFHAVSSPSKSVLFMEQMLSGTLIKH